MRRSLRRRSSFGTGVRGVLAVGFGLAALGLFALAFSVWHYLTLQRETTVAELSFQAIGPQRFQARVATADGPPSSRRRSRSSIGSPRTTRRWAPPRTSYSATR